MDPTDSVESVPYHGPQKSEHFEMNEFGQTLIDSANDLGGHVSRGVVRAERGILEPVNRFLNWRPWELFVRLAMIAILIVALHGMYRDKSSRNVQNYLLLLIAVSIFVQIHQNVNVQAQLAGDL